VGAGHAQQMGMPFGALLQLVNFTKLDSDYSLAVSGYSWTKNCTGSKRTKIQLDVVVSAFSCWESLRTDIVQGKHTT
jgi:hypothetical protein